MLEGVECELPPVLLGEYGNDPALKTVLVYGLPYLHVRDCDGR
jgi:hypothetical protein